MSALQVIRRAFNGAERELLQDSETGSLYMTSEQIGLALGYAEPAANIRKVYERHHDELRAFREDVPIACVNGCFRLTTIWRREALYLFAMFARTPAARTFRIWVSGVISELESVPDEHMFAAGPGRARIGYVYFVLVKELGRVKVGFTSRAPSRRFRSIRRYFPGYSVEFLGCNRGPVSLERRLHECLSRWRIGESEWFEASPSVLRVAATSQLREDLTVIDARTWKAA